MKLKTKSYYINKISSAISSIWFLFNKCPKSYRAFVNLLVKEIFPPNSPFLGLRES